MYSISLMICVIRAFFSKTAFHGVNMAAMIFANPVFLGSQYLPMSIFAPVQMPTGTEGKMLVKFLKSGSVLNAIIILNSSLSCSCV